MSSKRRNAIHNIALCTCPQCKADYDAGKRMSDLINTYRNGLSAHWNELRTKWLAFRLSDGTSDGVLYDRKRDAVRAQSDEFLCCYISFVNLVGGASPKECAIFLNFNRDAYDAGFRLPDPDSADGGMDVAPTAGAIDAVRNIIRPVLSNMSMN